MHTRDMERHPAITLQLLMIVSQAAGRVHLGDGVRQVGREGAVDVRLQLRQVDVDDAVVLCALI